MRAVLAIGDVTDGFATAIELNTYLLERPGSVDHRVRPGFDINHRAAHGVPAARAVSLLIALDVSGALEISDQIVFRNRLSDSNLLRRGVNAGRPSENITAKQIVNAP